MKFVVFSMLGACACLATPVVAAPVTYTVTGHLDSTYLVEGPDGAALAATMGTPTSFAAQFTFDPTQAQMGNLLYLTGIDAKVSVDGHSLGDFTPHFPGQNVVALGSSGGNDGYLDFQVITSGDLFPEIPGNNEAIMLEVKLYGGEANLPADGVIPGTLFTFVNSAVSLRYSGFVASGSSFASSLAERGTFGWNDAVTSLDVSPAPEPGEWAMLAAGLGIAGATARRRRR